MSSWDYRLFWQEAMNQFKEELGEHEFGLWFNIDYDSAEENRISVKVPSNFYRDQLIKSYQRRIEERISELAGRELSISFIVTRKGVSENSQAPQLANPSQNTSDQDKSEIKLPIEARKQTKRNKHPLLRPDYSFSSYVIGENNTFAANAAMAIAANPGSVYNPFLIYGGVGLGKTHLMQSIGNQVWQDRPDTKIICITAEEFTNEFIQSIRAQAPQAFKNKYRYVDVLLIDDIHFLSGKPGSQEELFHTFNALYDAGKAMVFTCDRPVSELKDLSDRLRSRFERGLNVDLQPPNYETRVAILKKKVENASVHVPDEVIEMIAKNISTNVRDLEAALMKLVAFADLVNKDITSEIAQQQLKDVFSQSKHGNVTIDNILRVVADYYKLSTNDLKGKKRIKNIVFPRQLAMFITREITEYSTTEIGMEFGGRDHTTVMHSCQKIDERLKVDPNLEITVQSIIRLVKEYSTKV